MRRAPWIAWLFAAATLFGARDARPREEAGAADAGAAADAAPLAGPPAGASPAERERWLQQKIDAAIAARPELGRARVGVSVIEVDTGRAIVQRAADEPFNVASNAKLVTTAVALSALGPEYRFKTSLLADGFDGRGTIAGDLILRGAGDPSFSSEHLWKLVADLKIAGVKRIDGSLVIDSTFFDGEKLPPAYGQKDEDAAFRAPVAAVSLNYNAVAVLVQPGDAAGQAARVSVQPASDYVVVVNEAVTIADGRTALRVGARGKGDRTEIRVTGTIRADAGAQLAKKRIEHPELFIGETLRAYLEAQGIRVARKPIATGATPGTARALATHYSEPVAVLVRELNKRSNNFIAEMLLKTVGAEVSGAPGTFAKGLAAARAWLGQVGLRDGTYRIENGSGLYDSNRFSPAQMTAILRHAYRDFRVASDFMAALALAGADGTIGHRMGGGPAERYVRAKTGTLKDVSCLSGYAGGTRGAPLAFAILVNALPDKPEAARAARALQDEIAQLLVLYLM